MGSPPISPDGHYWWDGQAWQPMAAAAPAPVLAQAAPVPAPAPSPAAEAPPSWLAAPPPAAAAPAPVPEPEPVYEAPAAGSPWSAPAPRPTNRMFIYGTGLLMIAVLGIVGVVAYGAMRSGANVASVQVSPSPLISDYERADRFLNVDLGPALVETNQALPGVNAQCTASLPPACKDALITLNKAMLDLDNAMTNNQRDIPPCIGPQVQQFKDDWSGMEQGVSMAIGGYTANSRTLILQGLQKFAAIAQYVKPDVDRINAAEQACKKTV